VNKTNQKIINIVTNSYFIAAVILVSLNVWMLSGVDIKVEEATVEPAQLMLVKTQILKSEKKQYQITAFGKFEASRVAHISSERAGKISEFLVDEGSFVFKGQELASIESDTLLKLRAYKKSQLDAIKMEMDAVKELHLKDLQSAISFSNAISNYRRAESELDEVVDDISKASILIPFDGVINETYVEIGDHVSIGEKVAILAELDPILVSVYVTEKQVTKLWNGESALISPLNGQTYPGKIRYISSIADPKTSTYKISVEVENPDGLFLSGMSSKVVFPLEFDSYVKISPAILSLDEVGRIGLKTVEDGIVKFVPVDLSNSEPDGIWVKGLGITPEVIVLGQGFVKNGDKVDSQLVEVN